MASNGAVIYLEFWEKKEALSEKKHFDLNPETYTQEHRDTMVCVLDRDERLVRLFYHGELYQCYRGSDKMVRLEEPLAPLDDFASQSLVKGQLVKLFVSAKTTIFEDGMHSLFSRGLFKLLDEHGIQVLENLTTTILYTNDVQVSAEALKWVGLHDNEALNEAKIDLLSVFATSSHYSLRCAAVDGFAYLEDSRAIPHLEAAYAEETDASLKHTIEQVLEQLRGEG